jgi:hypothetical protein
MIHKRYIIVRTLVIIFVFFFYESLTPAQHSGKNQQEENDIIKLTTIMHAGKYRHVVDIVPPIVKRILVTIDPIGNRVTSFTELYDKQISKTDFTDNPDSFVIYTGNQGNIQKIEHRVKGYCLGEKYPYLSNKPYKYAGLLLSSYTDHIERWEYGYNEKGQIIRQSLSLYPSDKPHHFKIRDAELNDSSSTGTIVSTESTPNALKEDIGDYYYFFTGYIKRGYGYTYDESNRLLSVKIIDNFTSFGLPINFYRPADYTDRSRNNDNADNKGNRVSRTSRIHINYNKYGYQVEFYNNHNRRLNYPFSRVDVKFLNDNSDELEVQYLDDNGKISTAYYGVEIIHLKFNKFDLPESVTFYNKDLSPVNCIYGWAKTCHFYDEQGRREKSLLYKADGNILDSPELEEKETRKKYENIQILLSWLQDMIFEKYPSGLKDILDTHPTTYLFPFTHQMYYFGIAHPEEWGFMFRMNPDPAFETLYGHYALFMRGPDFQRDTYPEYFIPFDPTNGANSRGDVILSERSREK